MMERRPLIFVPLLSLCSPWARAGLSEGDAASGIRAALERGCTAAVAQLGRADGFLANPAVRIELPAISRMPPSCSRTWGRGARSMSCSRP